MPQSAHSRTLQLLKELGYITEIVERVFPGQFPPRKYDFLGLGDSIAIDSYRTVLVQATTGNGLSSHKKKALESEYLEPWCGGRGRQFWLVIWRKILKKRGGKQKIWAPRFFSAVEDVEGNFKLIERDALPPADWD